MKEFVCLQCNHRWYEPADNNIKRAWGCPNGCTLPGREISEGSSKFLIRAFERILDKEHDEKKKSQLRYHLNLLKGLKDYPE